MLIVKRVLCVGGTVVLQRTSLPVRNFTACHCLRSPKRKSPYSLYDSERYSSLVKSVMSTRVSSQTPETLQAEDEHIYGPIVQGQAAPTSTGPERRVPKTLHPLLNNDKIVETEEPESGLPARIVFDRSPGRTFVPSVSRILQQTLSPEQIFYLERWKKRMIAELGEDGFKEYTQSKYCATNVTILPSCVFMLKSLIKIVLLLRFIQARETFPFSLGGCPDVGCTMQGKSSFGGTRVSVWCTGIHGEHISHTGGCQRCESYWKHRTT